MFELFLKSIVNLFYIRLELRAEFSYFKIFFPTLVFIKITCIPDHCPGSGSQRKTPGPASQAGNW